MRQGRRIGALMVMTALILLPVGASASPPDAAWIPGIYDGDDGDDVISLVTETPASHHGVVHHLPFPALSSEDVVQRGLPRYESWPALQPPRGPPDRCRRNPTRCFGTAAIPLRLIPFSSRTSSVIAEQVAEEARGKVNCPAKVVTPVITGGLVMGVVGLRPGPTFQTSTSNLAASLSRGADDGPEK